MAEVRITAVEIEHDENTQVIIGAASFIKSTEDIYEALATSVPGIKFGLGFVEASGPRLVRGEGTDAKLEGLAKRNAMKIGAGHTFIVMVSNAFPINVVNALKSVQEVSYVICATANPLQVVIAESKRGRGIIGVIDGGAAKGIEKPSDKRARRKLLRDIGYKLK